MDPATTILHIWSSDEARTINTCQIFTEQATQAGFAISPSSTKRKGAYWLTTEPISRNEILSIDTPNTLLSTIFMPKGRFNYTLSMLQTDRDTDLKAQELYSKILEIKSIIDTENQEASERGEKINWGSNYAKYGDYVHNILPNIEGPEQMYRRKFIKGIKFLQKKSICAQNQDHIILFGHENILLYFLKTQFEKERFDNCEILGFSVDSENLKIRLEDGLTKVIPIEDLDK